jgi:hypothetical protein
LEEADKLGLCRTPSVQEEISGEERARERGEARLLSLDVAGGVLDKFILGSIR